MKIEQNTISRDWMIIHKGRKYYVNFTESDGQTLALFNRDNWEISEETENDVKELNSNVFNGMTAGQRRKAEDDARIVKELIRFCIDNWDNDFFEEIKRELYDRKELLPGQ